MNIEEIRKILPQSFPFLYVDKICSISDKNIKSQKNFTYNEHFFQGHFKEEAIVPGVILIESFAQTSGILLNSMDIFDSGETAYGYLLKVKNMKFTALVRPGDILIINVSYNHGRGKVYNFSCEGRVDKKVVAKGELEVYIPDES